ncbi:radical SAM/SPASM domain-containing protein [Butyrivibrio sp. NC3005]|uniref:radical SAM/SPASM domain-containing protein n=1 Tax=Butyrivibrio sp. NC3005 TaxID=1280685 RepID=UPI00041BB277|nr:radical SAM protein [Butyrivibrio sp. NC3005]
MRYHSIDIGEGRYGVYFPDTMKLIKGNSATLMLLDKIISNESLEKIKEDGFLVSHEEYYNYRKMLGEGITHELPLRDKKHLGELIIHVSNDCNMRCLYCYGNGGCYNMKREFMDEETVIETLEKMYKIYPKIDLINFFGGEPTLNLNVIKAACAYVRANNKETILGMVSNGTYASKELLDIINEYDFKVTFSVDMQSMQDTLRPMVGGKPSFETVLKNFRYLKKYSSEPSGIEVTYTEMHRQKGISPADLVKEVRKIFGNIPMIFNPVSSCDEKLDIKDLSCFGESIEQLKGEPKLYSTTSFVQSVLLRLAEKNIKYQFCASGFGKTAVSTKGDIYPCQAFLGDENYRFGNVKDTLDVLKSSVIKKSDEMYNQNKVINGKCKDCYLNTYCHRCIHDNSLKTCDVGVSPDDMCEMQKDVFDRVIRNKLS